LKRQLRKQIKEDEFRSGLESGFAWLREHQQEVKVTGIVLAGVLVGGIALSSYQTNRRTASVEAFSEALEIFQAPLENELPEGAPRPAGPVFASREQKFTKAAAAFDGVERSYGSLPAGRRGSYYAALCRVELGDLAAAEKGLSELAARRDSDALLSALSRLALADLKGRAGSVDEAVDAYLKLVEDPTSLVPRDHALMQLASTLEQAARRPEAESSYRRLVEEFPASVYAPEARRRADYLKDQG